MTDVKPTRLISSPRILHGRNPFDAPKECDLLRPVRPELPNYSETMYFGICDRHQPGLGMFLHTGRLWGDLDMWWTRNIIFLPGGEAIMDRNFGRAPDNRGPASGNSRYLCVEEHRRWKLTYDGAAERTTREQSATALVGAGPVTPAGFDLDLEAVTPIWDMEGALGIAETDPDLTVWAHGHQQQAFLATGSVRVGDETWEFDGVANRDHSWGTRDMAHYGGHAFASVIFPESRRLVMGMTMFDRSGQPSLQVGYTAEGDTMELFGDYEIPWAIDSYSNPRTDLEFSFRRTDGSKVRMTGEGNLQHVGAGSTR